MFRSIYYFYVAIASIILVGAVSTHLKTNFDLQHFLITEECEHANLYRSAFKQERESIIAVCKDKKIAALEKQYSSVGWLIK